VPLSITRQGKSRVSGWRSGRSIVPTTRSIEALDDLGQRLADRRQVDVLPARHLHVVEPDDPDVLGNRQPRLLDRDSAPIDSTSSPQK
jgi:hypothetical protein